MSLQNQFQKIVNTIPQRFQPKQNKGNTYKVLFYFSDAAELSFIVSVEKDHCKLIDWKNDFKNDCKVESTLSDYVALEMGELNPQMALMNGKLKVSDIAMMLDFSKAFIPYDIYESENSETEASSEVKKKRPAKPGPLQNLMVLDFTKLLPGPLCTRILADKGADIIKIESPNSPDSIRNFPPFEGDKSLFYLGLNRNKKSYKIDFQNEAGREKLYELIAEADVLVEQFRPGVMKAFGLDYETVREINPQLIYVSITGYGQSGKFASEPGHDINYMARSGVLSQIKDKKGRPFVPAVQIADIVGGSMHAIQEILLALLDCYQNDQGKFIDVNMTGGVTQLMSLSALHKQGSGSEDDFVLNGKFVNYSIYQSKEGVNFALGALEPKFWNCFCKHIGKEEWKSRVLSNDTEHIAELENLFASQDAAYWRKIEQAGDACLTEVLSMEKAMEQFPQFWSKTKEGKSYPANPNEQYWEAPEVGEDF